MSEITQTVNDELQRIYDTRGRLVATDVVAEAKKKGSPLHDHFTWENKEAADQWRLAEAAALIRRAKIVVTKDPDTVTRVRAFVSVLNEGERSYMPTRLALETHRDQVIEQALRDIEAMRRRYAALVDFDEILRLALERSDKAA